MSRIEEALQKLFDKYRVLDFSLLNPDDEQLRDYQLDKKKKYTNHGRETGV